jgi:virginiamycin B lyase
MSRLRTRSRARTSRAIAVFLTIVCVILSLPSVHAVTISSFFTPTGGSGPVLITNGPDGSLWFTEFNAGQVAKINTSGQVTEFQTSSNISTPEAIATGSDGNIWFSEAGIGKLARTTPKGAMTEFALPNHGAPDEIAGMTKGPDGAIWFTERIANLIGRISITGAITEFPIPTPASSALGITSGPDGALWFTEKNAARIGRITTQGAVTEFPIPSNQNFPNFITTGPDGNLWFTEGGVGKIGRITTSGQIAEFPIPTPTGGPNGITAGADGALWFTETDPSANSIGRITTSGSVTECPIPIPMAQAVGIASGPDGALWFAETNMAIIGRLVPDTSQSKADLSITDMASAATVATGTQLTYTVTVNNAGPDPAIGVSANASVPAGATFASVSGAGAIFSTPAIGSPGKVTALYTAIPPGGSASFSFTVNVLAASGATLSSTAMVTSNVPDPNTANNSVTVSTSVQGGGVVELMWTPPVSTASTPTPPVADLRVGPGAAPPTEAFASADAGGESAILPSDATCTLLGYNVYASSSQQVFAVANLVETIGTVSSTTAPVMPTGTTFYGITALWNCGGQIHESALSNVVSACAGPTISSLKVTGKIKVFGSGFADGVQVFIGQTGFVKPAVFTGNPAGGVQVIQKGALTNGAGITDATPPGTTVLITFQQNGCFSSVLFSR